MKQVEPELVLPRLRDADEPALARAVAGLRDNGPDVTELASLASQLTVRGIGVTSPEVAPSPGSAALKKWLLAGGGAVAGLLAWLSLREPAPLPVTPVATVASPSVTIAPHALAPVTDPTPAALPRSRSGAAAPEPSVVNEPAPTDVPEPSAAIPSAGAVPHVAPAPTTPERLEPTTAPSRRTPLGASAVQPVVPELTSATAVPTEIELLRDARLALNQSPARALELAESHARTYPNGKLSQERELMAITALVSLGRRTAALSRASRFEQNFPQSPYRKQVSELLR